jgi:hypothetical protein
MAKDISLYRASAITHRQTCVLHDNERISMCSGTLRKGGICVNKATNPPVPGMMPTCKIHRDQLKVLGWCRAPLPCGFECDQMFEWKPHGFQLCPDHREYSTTCYFLNIPAEMRLRVYQFLLPDRPIPARYSNSRNLKIDGERVYTAILRVNHQIHDEAVGLLYGTGVFTIELSGNSLSMCNSTSNFVPFRFSDYGSHALQSYGNHALQDYQMQLMLLELQNKKRLLLERQEQDNINGESNSTRTPAARGIQLPTMSATHYPFRTIDPVWHPPLSKRYFNMIRSFFIELVFLSSGGPNSANHRVHGLSNADAMNDKFLEWRLYDHCDLLHRLIGRLQLIPRPIAKLEIIIKLCNSYIKREEAISAAQLLLQPFRRLRNVAKPEVLSITTKDFQDRERDLLIPDWISCAADSTVTDYVKCWSRDLSSSQTSSECPQVVEAYWQLEKLLCSIKEHCQHADPKFNLFKDLLHTARIAREADDLTLFKEIWDQVVNIWFDYLNKIKDFQSDVERSITSIYDIVGKDS